jgi:nucleoside-diphosphate-sugar epimerase
VTAVLITGGAGYLGRRVAERLASAGEQVTLFDLSVPAPESLPDGVRAHGGDVTNAAVLRSVLDESRPDAVIHLAALLTTASADDPVLATKVNCLGTATLFTLAAEARVKRTIFASSVAALSPTPGLTSGDNRPLEPRSVYGATKAYAEHLALALRGQNSALDLFGIRFGWLYGPGRVGGWNEVQSVIEGFAKELPKVRYPQFKKAMDWTFVDDATNALIGALGATRPNRVAYNLSGDYRTVEDAIGILGRWFPSVVAEGYDATLPPSAFEFESDAIGADLGVAAPTRLEAGLRITIDQIRANKASSVP